MTTELRLINAQVADERAPMLVRDANHLAVRAQNPSGLWIPARGVMEGVADGSALPFKWKSLMTGMRAFIPAVEGNEPIFAHDDDLDLDYVQIGYGGSLTPGTNTLVDLRLKSGGSGYAVGNTVTLTGGVIITVTAVSSGAITAWTLTNAGSFSSRPGAILTQTATSGSGTNAQFDGLFRALNGSLAINVNFLPSNGIWTIYAIVRVPIVGGVAGANPGGLLFGTQLGQSEISDANTNNRWFGVGVNSSGGFTFYEQGNANSITGTQPDRRDGEWHLIRVTANPGIGAGSATLWVDGTLVASDNDYAAVNSLLGALRLRVGASGLPASGPITGGAFDFGGMAVFPIDMAASANAAAATAVQTALLAMIGR